MEACASDFHNTILKLIDDKQGGLENHLMLEKWDEAQGDECDMIAIGADVSVNNVKALDVDKLRKWKRNFENLQTGITRIFIT